MNTHIYFSFFGEKTGPVFLKGVFPPHSHTSRSINNKIIIPHLILKSQNVDEMLRIVKI